MKKISLWLKVFLTDFFLKIKRIKIIEVKTDEQKKVVYKLRYQVYKEYGYIDSKDFQTGEMKDEDDKHSINFLALKNNQPVGTIRLIYGQKREDFPTFRMWNVDFSKFSVPFSKIGEISKFCIVNSKNLKNLKFWIWLGMMKKVYEWSKKLGLICWMFVTSSKIKSDIKKKFYTPVHPFFTLKETELNIKERKVVAGFFQKFNPFCYFLNLKEIGKI